MICKILEYAERVSNDPEGTPYQSYGQLRKKCNCPDCKREKRFIKEMYPEFGGEQ